MVRFDDFSAGLWIPGEAGAATEQAGFAIPAAGLLAADNVDFLSEGAVRGRRGSAKANPAAQRVGAIRALTRFYGRAQAIEQISGFGPSASDPTPGGAPWTNPLGAGQLLDNSLARAGLLADTSSEYLVRVSLFGVTPIPANATITGIRVRVWFKVGPQDGVFSDGALPTGGVRIQQDGAYIGTAQRATFITRGKTGAVRAAFVAGAAYPVDPFLGILEYGGQGNTWGLSAAQLSPAAFNAPDFGVGYRVQCATSANALVVDYMEVTAFYAAATMTSFLVAHDAGANLTWQKLSAGAFTAITGGSYPDPGRRPWIVPWPQKNALFLFDGVNVPKVFDGSTIADVTTLEVADGGAGIAPKKGPYACLHRNRIWATDPGELQYSVYASDINQERNWRPQLQLACNDSRGGKITGLASFVDRLIIFKDTALFAFSGDPEFGGQLLEYDTAGCVAPDTIQVTPFGVIFLARDGLRITDGQTSSLLSMPIKPLFRSRSADAIFTNAVGVYYARHNQYVLKLDPTLTDGYVLNRITFPTDQGEAEKTAWSRIPDLPMNAATVWGGSEDLGELYVGDLNGWVWQRDTGTTDEGIPFFSYVVTQQRVLDDQTRHLGRIYQIRPLFRCSTAVLMGLRYDQNLSDDVPLILAGATVGSPEFQEPRVFVGDDVHFGRFVAVSVLSAASRDFELHRIDLDTRMRGPKVWR